MTNPARRLESVPATPRRRRRRLEVVTPHEAEVERAVAAMPLEVVQCRDTGHTWRRANARWLDGDNCWEQTLICRQCTTERRRYLSARGAILDSRYAYAEGYVVKGIGRLTSSDRDALRLRGVTES